MKHHDESMALAALFDCWTPTWRVVDGPHWFRTDVTQALRSFGFTPLQPSTFSMTRMGKNAIDIGPHKQTAILLTTPQLRGSAFIFTFRRDPPQYLILAAKSGLWWAVWDFNPRYLD